MNRTASTATARRRWWRLHPTTMTAAATATNNKLSIHVTTTTTTDHADWALPTSCEMTNKELSMLHSWSQWYKQSIVEHSLIGDWFYGLIVGEVWDQFDESGQYQVWMRSHRRTMVGRDGARVDMRRLLEPSDTIHHPILFIPDHQQPEALERLLADPDIGPNILLIPS